MKGLNQMALRPKKWFLYSPVAILPLIAAWALNTPTVVGSLTQQAGDALKGAGADWAKLTMDGRDATVAGDSPSQEQLDAAVKAVAGTYGVRLVQAAARVVPPAPPPAPKVDLAPPTINPVGAPTLPLVVSGTWPEADAAGLKASLADKTWELGKDAALTSDGKGTWTFKPDVDLAPGTYDLAIEVTGKDGSVVTDTTKNEIVILPPVPDAVPPTVTSIETNKPQPEITGTWPSAIAKTLTVTVGAVPYVLGKAAELTVDKDNWKLVPSAPLADGTVDVGVEITDALGRVVKAVTPGKLTIDTVAPAAPTVAPIDTSKSPLVVTGTWAEGDATSLIAKLADKVWTFGKDAAFASDGKGNWSFTPDVALKPGTYPLSVETADKVGNATSVTADVVVPEPAAPPPQMVAPTVTALSSDVARPVVKGTWSEMAAKSLAVTVASKTYTLGTDENLTSDGVGNWSLALDKPLADGTYDVSVETADAAGNKLSGEGKGALVVDAAAPASPQVKLVAGESSPAAVTGTWDSANATSLKVAIPAANIAATLGTDASLTADKDAWSLALASPLAPGSYDVVVESADAKGRVSRDQTRFEVLVKEPAAPPPAPAAELKLPTITAYSGEASPASMSGTWDEGAATGLSVAIPGAKIAEALGTGTALTSDGKGAWTLNIGAALPPGIYDVAVTETAADGRKASDASTAEIYIKAPPPPPPAPPELKAPTVNAYAGEGSPAAITGTWDEAAGGKIAVSIPAATIAAELGASPALTSDGKGNWSLAIETPLAAGTYNVTATVTAADGRTITDTSSGEIVVKEAPPFDCEGALAAITKDNPLLFGFNMSDVVPPYDAAVKNYAALLAGKDCSNTKLLAMGYTDYKGGSLYNEALSLKRAQHVADILAANGVDMARIEVSGKGKNDPVDPAHEAEARAKNRRVEITIVK